MGLLMSRAARPVPFAEWAPDRATQSAWMSEVKGVISQGGRYAPWSALTAYKTGAAIPGTCIGARGFWSSSGDVNIFMGDESDLYKSIARQPTVVSKAGGYTASATDGWQFEQFGDFIIAVNANVAPQVFELGSSSAFADLGGSPPTARAVGRVLNQLVLANGRTLSVSGFNDITNWLYETATQGVQVDVDQRGGNVQTIVGGEVGLIFQERGITRMTYVGPPTVFDLSVIEWKHGAISREAVSQYGRLTYFASETGLMVTDSMSEARSIGVGKVDKWFADNLNYSQRHKVCTAVDFARKLWLVALPTGGSSVADHLLIYSMEDNRWTHDDLDVQMLFEMPREGITVDDAAAIIALEGTNNADEIETSVDSPQWRETRVQAAAITAKSAIRTVHTLDALTASYSGSVVPGVPLQTAGGDNLLTAAGDQLEVA